MTKTIQVPDEIETAFPRPAVLLDVSPACQHVAGVDPATGEVIQSATLNPIETMLADYENLAAMLDVIRMNMAEAKAAVIPQDIQNDLEAIEAEFGAKIEQGEARMAELKAAIAAGVKNFGKTVNGAVYQAQYVKSSWTLKDPQGLLAYAASGHPEVMRFLEESKPSARVVVRRGGK